MGKLRHTPRAQALTLLGNGWQSTTAGSTSCSWLGRDATTVASHTKHSWVTKPGPSQPHVPLLGRAPLSVPPGKGKGLGFVLQPVLVLIATSPGACNGLAATLLALPAARCMHSAIGSITTGTRRVPIVPTAASPTSEPTEAPLLVAASPPIAPGLHNSPPWGSSHSAPVRADSAPDAAGTSRWPQRPQGTIAGFGRTR